MAQSRPRGPRSHRALRFEPLEQRLALSGTVVDHLDLAIVPQLPQSAMDLVGQQRWFFSHASVGTNMRNGIDDLHALDSQRYQLAISNVNYNTGEERANDAPATTVPGTIYACGRSNPGWEKKLTIFQDSVSISGWHDAKVDAVMDKFCYIDQNASAATYLSTMSALEAAYPDTHVVYITMPIRTAGDEKDVLRNQYNQAVRSYCAANNKILFDLADIEAHDPEGNEHTFESGGVTYQKLYSGYTTDGGHLNDAANLGRQQAARGWYATAALLAGVLGTPTDLTLSNASVSENLPAGTTVGTLGTVDRDTEDEFVYELIAGEGSQHNGLFQVVGNQLQTAGPLDFETTPSCQVRLRTTDGAGLTFEKGFSISVTDVEELCDLDADGNGVCGALSDGILILRYLLEPGGTWNVDDAVDVGATRTTWGDIRAFLDAGAATVLDADGDGTSDPLGDGILILRYLFDPAGPWRVDDALSPTAARTTRAQVKAHLDTFNPGLSSALAGALSTGDNRLTAAGATAAIARSLLPLEPGQMAGDPTSLADRMAATVADCAKSEAVAAAAATLPPAPAALAAVPPSDVAAQPPAADGAETPSAAVPMLASKESGAEPLG